MSQFYFSRPEAIRKLAAAALACFLASPSNGAPATTTRSSGRAGSSAASAGADADKKSSSARYDDFAKLAKDHNYGEAEKAMVAWRAADANDPELAVARANLLWQQANERGLQINGFPMDENGRRKPPADIAMGGDDSGIHSLALQDRKTSEVVGEIRFGPDRALAQEAIAILREAASQHPERLDIRFGLAHMLSKSGQEEEMLPVLREAANYAAAHPRDMRWMRNAPLPAPTEKYVPETLHSYGGQQRGSGADGWKRMREIAVIASETFPHHPFAWNDLAAYENALTRDDEKALAYLLKAHDADPKDALVALNIAGCYGNKGDTAMKREFLQRTVSLDPKGDFGREAKEQLATAYKDSHGSDSGSASTARPSKRKAKSSGR